MDIELIRELLNPMLHSHEALNWSPIHGEEFDFSAAEEAEEWLVLKELPLHTVTLPALD